MSIAEFGSQIARAAAPVDKIDFGPWEGSMRSIAADAVPRTHIAAGSNFLYLPRSGHWRRRGGQSLQFESGGIGAMVGLLPAKWGGRARWMEEFISDAVSDGVPTLIALVTKETMADSSAIDDGRFSNLYVRDQVNSLNYTVGSEFSDDTYPEPGAVQSLRFIPVWYDSGQGGLTRGATEFARRFFFSGSRRFIKVANWFYLPSVYGTPTRWNGGFASSGAAAATVVTASSSGDSNYSNIGAWETQPSGSPSNMIDVSNALKTDDDATLYLSANLAGAAGRTASCKTTGVFTPGSTYTIRFKARRTGSVGTLTSFTTALVGSDGNVYSGSINGFTTYTPNTDFTTSWAYYEDTVSLLVAGTSGQPTNCVRVTCSNTETPGTRVDVTYIEVSSGTGEASANRLIPSGPIPPTHAGVLVKGNPVAGSSGISFMRPDADVDPGAWTSTGASLFSVIDETTADDTDYITDAGAPGALCEVGFDETDLGFEPTSTTHNVKLSIRAGNFGIVTTATLTIRLQDAGSTFATAVWSGSELNSPLGAFRWLDYDLTASEIDAANFSGGTITAEIVASGVGTTNMRVSYVALEVTATGETLEGGWRGKDRFFYSVAYRFADDSVWLPCPPRFPNDILSNGFNLFTVDADNTDTAFDKVTWTNLPVPPFDVKSKLLLRCPKIDSTTSDNLQLNPTDLRRVAEVPADVTTYDDYLSEDTALGLDVSNLIIRYDHQMTPRARYVFAGDLRVCVGYGGTNPAAIEIAPVGRSADYDLNEADDDTTIYNENASYMRLTLASSGDLDLELAQSDGTSFESGDPLLLDSDDYPTLQNLVDRINATSFSTDGQQWRAQLCPGVSGDALMSDLLPHTRVIASCVVDNTAKTISKAAGGLSAVPVGAHVLRSGVATTGVISKINSDVLLTFTGSITAGTVDLTFYFELGDSPTAATADSGYQRVIANSLPGFLYFNKAYLNKDTFDKSATWMTVAGPGQSKSAPNCFSLEVANRHTPPLHAGVIQGGAAVDQGFVIPYANMVGAIRNVRDSGTGVDSDYRLQMINESRGCCAWNTVVGANRFVIYLTPEGLVAADLFDERLLSEAIYLHAPATGDLDFEIPKCIAATARDIDYSVADTTITAYAAARVMRGAIWLVYRNSGSSPDRMVAYDFSTGHETNGLAALVRSPGKPWGWSVELAHATTPAVMCEGRRSDGAHLYGWNNANAGSTGDGRIDEFETGDTDNSTAIDGSVETPWEPKDQESWVSVQEFTAWHNAAAGSTGQYIFHRALSDTDQYTFTPSTGTEIYQSDIKLLTLPARTITKGFYWAYRQQTGTARTLRRVQLRVKRFKRYK